MSTKTIRWVLAHEPLDIFLRAAEKFAAKVAETTNNGLNVEILSLSEYADKYNNGVAVAYEELVEHLNAGGLEMSQMYTHNLGKFSKDLRALDMPFLFTDHAHASRVLDGAIGKNLLKSLQLTKETENVKGLAFTYSGGFTMISTNREITTLADLAGLKLRVPPSPIIGDYFKELGADSVTIHINEVTKAFENGQLDGAEFTYRRLYEAEGQKYTNSVLHSNHNIFLTSIIINQKFWDSLDADLQKAITEAAMIAAHEEREEAIDDDAVHREKCVQDGITVTELAGELEQQFRAKGDNLYTKYAGYFTPGLIKKIKLA